MMCLSGGLLFLISRYWTNCYLQYAHHCDWHGVAPLVLCAVLSRSWFDGRPVRREFVANRSDSGSKTGAHLAFDFGGGTAKLEMPVFFIVLESICVSVFSCKKCFSRARRI